jgi:hypothetical protein
MMYHDWKYVFSKKASDTLPPDRHCNHKIELEDGVSPIGHSLLYKQSISTVEQLEAAKKYMTENLNKWMKLEETMKLNEEAIPLREKKNENDKVSSKLNRAAGGEPPPHKL